MPIGSSILVPKAGKKAAASLRRVPRNKWRETRSPTPGRRSQSMLRRHFDIRKLRLASYVRRTKASAPHKGFRVNSSYVVEFRMERVGF